MTDPIQTAAAWVRSADRFVFATGAGMGVDSGLPDFRGAEGFWRAYPAFRHLGIDWRAMARPAWFEQDPELAWGFYGHRINSYRTVTLHEGYTALQSWTHDRPSFIFTSNVDEAFQRAGWDTAHVYEVHGSLSWLQCTALCTFDCWRADDITFDVDPETCRLRSPLPRCPSCGEVARPNAVLFGDHTVSKPRIRAQKAAYEAWLTKDPGLVVIEVGAGLDIPTVRKQSRHLQVRYKARVIRINPVDDEAAPGMIALKMGGRDALVAIDEAL